MSTQLKLLLTDFLRSLSLTLPKPFALPLQITLDEMTVTFDQRSNFPNELLIYTSLGIVPVENEQPLYRAFWEANLFWSGTADATIGVNSATREAIIAYSFDFQKTEGVTLVALVEQFVALTELWLRFISAPAEAEAIQPIPSLMKPKLKSR